MADFVHTGRWAAASLSVLAAVSLSVPGLAGAAEANLPVTVDPSSGGQGTTVAVEATGCEGTSRVTFADSAALRGQGEARQVRSQNNGGTVTGSFSVGPNDSEGQGNVVVNCDNAGGSATFTVTSQEPEPSAAPSTPSSPTPEGPGDDEPASSPSPEAEPKTSERPRSGEAPVATAVPGQPTYTG